MFARANEAELYAPEDIAGMQVYWPGDLEPRQSPKVMAGSHQVLRSIQQSWRGVGVACLPVAETHILHTASFDEALSGRWVASLHSRQNSFLQIHVACREPDKHVISGAR